MMTGSLSLLCCQGRFHLSRSSFCAAPVNVRGWEVFARQLQQSCEADVQEKKRREKGYVSREEDAIRRAIQGINHVFARLSTFLFSFSSIFPSSSNIYLWIVAPVQTRKQRSL